MALDTWMRSHPLGARPCTVTTVAEDEQRWLERIERARQIIDIMVERAGDGIADLAAADSDLARDDVLLGRFRATDFQTHSRHNIYYGSLNTVL